MPDRNKPCQARRINPCHKTLTGHMWREESNLPKAQSTTSMSSYALPHHAIPCPARPCLATPYHKPLGANRTRRNCTECGPSCDSYSTFLPKRASNLTSMRCGEKHSLQRRDRLHSTYTENSLRSTPDQRGGDYPESAAAKNSRRFPEGFQKSAQCIPSRDLFTLNPQDPSSPSARPLPIPCGSGCARELPHTARRNRPIRPFVL